MSTRNLQSPIFIDNLPALKQLAETLSNESIIAVDTESNSLFAYQEQVCLIQFSTAKKDFLVDPIAIKDLSPLAPIFQNVNIEKVFHAAEYDIMCLRRDFDFTFANLFDTMVAASILGYNKLGLGNILQNEFGIKVDKHNQRANWGKRPLPNKMLTYAQIDTHYLISLRNKFKNELNEKKLLPLALEDFRRLQFVKFTNGNHTANHNGNRIWRIKGIHDLTPKQAAVLQELYNYREKAARKMNRPLFKVIGDKTLIAIAVQMPENTMGLRQIPGMSKHQIERHGNQIIQALRNGKQAKPLYPPKRNHPNNRTLKRMDALKYWRKSTAENLGVKSDVVLPRDLLQTIVDQNPQNIEELNQILVDVPWRMEHFGNQILEVLSNT